MFVMITTSGERRLKLPRHSHRLRRSAIRLFPSCAVDAVDSASRPPTTIVGSLSRRQKDRSNKARRRRLAVRTTRSRFHVSRLIEIRRAPPPGGSMESCAASPPCIPDFAVARRKKKPRLPRLRCFPPHAGLWKILMPIFARAGAFARSRKRSLPLTCAPKFFKSSARPHMPMPPIPMK